MQKASQGFHEIVKLCIHVKLKSRVTEGNEIKSRLNSAKVVHEGGNIHYGTGRRGRQYLGTGRDSREKIVKLARRKPTKMRPTPR